MWLLVGLGNPGNKYKDNRHNIGFMAIDAIAEHFEFAPARAKFQGLIAEGKISGSKVILLKPKTYMNESGQSVGQVANFYKIEPSRIVAFHDELDLAPAKLRVKTGGGNAGHNGLKSMQAHLGTGDFVRVRMGIGHPGDKDRVSDYVLSDFAKSEQPWVETMVRSVAHNAALLLKNKDNDFMTKVAMDLNPKEPKLSKPKEEPNEL
jgi:PTH1 family peptidyl-tRNA hydrolase